MGVLPILFAASAVGRLAAAVASAVAASAAAVLLTWGLVWVQPLAWVLPELTAATSQTA